MQIIDASQLKEVTSSNLYLDKNFTKIDQNGLISEVIFGTTVNYRCTCGNLNSKILHEGQTCSSCNVICESSEVRYTRFGKINLVFPIIKKQKIDKILKIIKKKNKYILDPTQVDLTTTIHAYLKYDNYADEFTLETTYTDDCIPLPVTGIFSLYINIYTLYNYFHSSFAEEILTYFTDTIFVTPPNTRQSTINDEKGNKKIYRSELDELYAKIISTNNYNKENFANRISIEEYYQMIKISLDRKTLTPIIDDELKMLDRLTGQFQYFVNDIYNKVSASLSGKEGHIRKDFLGKYVDKKLSTLN